MEYTTEFKTLIKTMADRAGLVADEKLEAYTELVLTQVTELVMQCDPSSKMVPHEPYITIINSIDDYFYYGRDTDGEPVEPGVIWE